MRFVQGGAAATVAAALAASLLSACTGTADASAPETARGGAAGAGPAAYEDAVPFTEEELLARMADGAAEPTADGAILTALYFLGQYGPMFLSGDTRAWEALSRDGCEYCAEALANARRVRDEGWEAFGGALVFDPDLTSGMIQADGRALVILVAQAQETELVRGSRHVIGAPAMRVTFVVTLVRNGRLWTVAEVLGSEA